jgi:hypothetical protein
MSSYEEQFTSISNSLQALHAHITRHEGRQDELAAAIQSILTGIQTQNSRMAQIEESIQSQHGNKPVQVDHVQLTQAPRTNEFRPPKIPICADDPWAEPAKVVSWLDMTAAAAKRTAGQREEFEAWILSRAGNPLLATLIRASARRLRDESYEYVLLDVRDRLTGVPSSEADLRWKEAAMSIHQGSNESLSALLGRLEYALNAFEEHCPSEATAERIYEIYRASLSDRTRAMLDTKHNFGNRARELDVDEKTQLLLECLHMERISETPLAKIRGITTSGNDGAVGPSCRTCNTNDHSFKTCEKARQKVTCPRCDGANHFRFECPKLVKKGTTAGGSDQTSSTTTTPIPAQQPAVPTKAE